MVFERAHPNYAIVHSMQLEAYIPILSPDLYPNSNKEAAIAQADK